MLISVPELDDILDAADVGGMLRVSKRVAQAKLRRGEIAGMRVGRNWFTTFRMVVRYIEEGGTDEPSEC
ncbi:helix-turn-helix domain-containing protein [bacterium]|nr:helix-turn-helix domain-containing protein [bacterium]